MDFGNNHPATGQWLDVGMIGAGARLVANHMIDDGYGPSVNVEHSPGGATGATEPRPRSKKRKTRSGSVEVANPTPQEPEPEPEDMGPSQGQNCTEQEYGASAGDFAAVLARDHPEMVRATLRIGNHLRQSVKRFRGLVAGIRLKERENDAVRAQLVTAVDMLRAEIEGPPGPPALESDSDDPQIKQQLQIQRSRITEARRFVQQHKLAGLLQFLQQLEESEYSSPVQPDQAPVAGDDRHALIDPVTPSPALPALPANTPATRRLATPRCRITSSAPTPSCEVTCPAGPDTRAPDVSLQMTRVEQQKQDTAGFFDMTINGIPDKFSVSGVLTQQQINALPVFQKGAKGARDSAEFCHFGMEYHSGGTASNNDINGTPSSSSLSASSFAPSLAAAGPFSMQEQAPAQPFAESYDLGVSQMQQYRNDSITSLGLSFDQHDILPQQQDLAMTNYDGADCQTEAYDSDDVYSEDEYSKDGHLHNHSQPQPDHDHQNQQFEAHFSLDYQNQHMQPHLNHDHQNQQLQAHLSLDYQNQQVQADLGLDYQNQQVQADLSLDYQNQQLQANLSLDYQNQHLHPHHDHPHLSDHALSFTFSPSFVSESTMAAMALVKMTMGCETKCPLDRILVTFLKERRQLIIQGVPMETVTGPCHPSMRSLLDAEHSRFAHPVSRFMVDILAMFENLTGLPERVAVLYNMISLLRWQLDPIDMNRDSMPGYMMPVGNQLTHPHPAWIDYIPFPAMRQRIIAEGTAMTAHLLAAGIHSDGKYRLNDGAPVAEFIETYPFESIRDSFFGTLSVNWPYLDTDTMVADPDSAEIMLNPVFMRHLIQPGNWSLGDAFANEFPNLAGTYPFKQGSGPSGL